MKYLKLLFVCAFVSTFIGCAQGRLALVDLDLRTPEQMSAYKDEAKVVYQDDKVAVKPVAEDDAKVESKTTPDWNILASVIKVVKGRVRVLSLEWKN